jgi:hypothetical protein
MPAAEISVDRDPVGAGQEFAVAIRTSPVAPAAVAGAGPGASYAIVLDASSSMTWPAEQNGTTSRWELALRAIAELLRKLPGGDEIQVVAFSDRAWPLYGATTVADLRKSDILGQELPPGFGTNIEGGLRLAYDLLGGSAAAARRAILLSDGEPNYGMLTAGELGAVAAEAAGDYIYTDAVGMGAGVDIELLAAISAYGSTGHVTSADGAQDTINDVVDRLTRQAQDLAASGGELRVDVHPQFPVDAVYQVHPNRKRMAVRPATSPDGAQRVVVPVGAVGTGNEQPLFLLRLRAPDRNVSRALHIVTVTGRLRIGQKVVALDKAEASVTGIAATPVINFEQLMPQARAIDLEADIARTIKEAGPSDRAGIYAEAKDRALAEGLYDLARDYDAAIQGLQRGLEANDVHADQRTRSSTSRTTPNELLREVARIDPKVVPARKAGRAVQRGGAAGKETSDW